MINILDDFEFTVQQCSFSLIHRIHGEGEKQDGVILEELETLLLARAGAKATVRQAAHKLGPVITDNGNNLIDALFGPIDNPRELNGKLHSVQDLIETELFIGYSDIAYIGTKNDVKQLEPKS